MSSYAIPGARPEPLVKYIHSADAAYEQRGVMEVDVGILVAVAQLPYQRPTLALSIQFVKHRESAEPGIGISRFVVDRVIVLIVGTDIATGHDVAPFRAERRV